MREAAISRKGREGGVREGPSEGPGAGSLPAIVTERHPVAWYTAAPAPACPGDGRSSVRAPVRRMTTGFNCSINHYFRSPDVGPPIPIDQLVMFYELIFDYFIGMLSTKDIAHVYRFNYNIVRRWQVFLSKRELKLMRENSSRIYSRSSEFCLPELSLLQSAVFAIDF